MLKKFCLTLIVFFAASVSHDCVAAITKSGSAPLSYGSQVTLTSEVLGRDHKVDIYLPQGYELMGDSVRYPVIYTLDGWTLSHGVSGIVSHLGNTASMPKSIVVALHTPNLLEYLPKLKRVSGWRLGDSPSSVDKYMQFLKSELIPYIDKKYRTNDFRALIGMSPTAILALHTFLNEPELFDAHYLFAAMNIFDLGYEEDTRLLDVLMSSLEQNPNRKGHLYISSAASDLARRPKQNAYMEELRARFAKLDLKNLKYKIEAIEEGGHYPMAMAATISAIHFSFPTSQLEQLRKIVEEPGDALKKIDAFYTQLSSEYGYDIYPVTDLNRNVNCLRGVGYYLLRQERGEEAIDIFKRWTQLSPNDGNAYDSLADAYEVMGKHDLALKAHEKAVNIARRSIDTRLELFQQNLSDFKLRMAEKS